MRGRGPRAALALAVVIATACAAGATSTTPGEEKREDAAALQKVALTFPQAVRVGDLAGRDLLMPNEAQAVLGHIASPPAFKTPDGRINLLIRRGGLLGFGAVRIALPIETVALLGEHTVLVGLPVADFATLPEATPDTTTFLSSDTTVRMGIVGPFH